MPRMKRVGFALLGIATLLVIAFWLAHLWGRSFLGSYAVTWKNDVRRLAGKSVRLRFELKDADLYSFQFRE